MQPTPRLWLPGLVACGFIGVAAQGPGDRPEAAMAYEAPSVEASSEAMGPPYADAREAELRGDVRVTAFQRAYGALIDSTSIQRNDLVFHLADHAIYFQDGRMLAEERLDRRDRCDSIFYHYPLDMPTEPEPLPDEPVRLCTDVQEVLWGRTETQIRRNARSATFIGRRIFVNDVVADALVDVERDLRDAASREPAVAAWIDDVHVAYSFIDRGIAGTRTRSQHSWGLAVDFVPASYEGRQVYWRWTRAWNRSGWHQVPLEDRWSPPAGVIEIFEHHGFLWGGKWAHYDTVHFEYRPEILEYNRLLAAAEQ
ncbi:MAG: M15 family metallopeptidase [Gemmatimonadota bacterium]